MSLDDVDGASASGHASGSGLDWFVASCDTGNSSELVLLMFKD